MTTNDQKKKCETVLEIILNSNGFQTNIPEANPELQDHLVNLFFIDGKDPINLDNLQAKEGTDRTGSYPPGLVEKLRPTRRIVRWLGKQPYSKYMEAYLRCLNAHTSANTYLFFLMDYLEYSNLNCIQFVEMEPRLRHDSMVKWLHNLADRNLKKSSKKIMITAVEKFLQANLQEYFPKALHMFITDNDCNEIGGWEAYENADIIRMLACATMLRTIALIHFFKDTGARPGSLCDPVIRMKHLSRMSDGCYSIRLYDSSPDGVSESSTTGLHVFMTKEGTDAIENYHNFRKSHGEVFTSETPLFASSSKRQDHLTVYDVYRIFKELHEKASIQKVRIGSNPRGRNSKAMVYGFRKRYQNALVLNGTIHVRVIDKLMGHKGELHNRYFRPSKEQLYQEYLKVAPTLMVGTEAKLKIEIEEKNKRLAELEVKEKERIQLAGENEKLKHALLDKVLNSQNSEDKDKEMTEE